jgi:tRNA threonylcarbamoyladenosine biosynthesis protein TsaB
MTYILHIETATARCSVALSKDRQLLALRESMKKNSHASLITIFIEEVTKEAAISINSINAVAVSKGPGSYTGLRIGVSAAKGLCYALDVPLIAVSTLQTMAYGLSRKYLKKDNLLFCPMIDARRMEVYHAVYDSENKEIISISAEIITYDFLHDLLNKNKIIFFGDGAEKCKSVLKNSNAIFIDDILPSASDMIEPVFEKFLEKEFEDLAYFEPFYLKDFVAGKPKVKGLY